MRSPVPALLIAGPDTPIQTPPDSRTAPNDNPKSGAHKNIGKYSNRAIAFSNTAGEARAGIYGKSGVHKNKIKSYILTKTSMTTAGYPKYIAV